LEEIVSSALGLKSKESMKLATSGWLTAQSLIMKGFHSGFIILNLVLPADGSACFLLGLHFRSEDGGHAFLSNGWLICMELHGIITQIKLFTVTAVRFQILNTACFYVILKILFRLTCEQSEENLPLKRPVPSIKLHIIQM
jgi:hypothetical protein